jgi:hypothetical protein
VRDSEICNFQPSPVVEKQVRGLQIPMDDPRVAVGILQCGAELNDPQLQLVRFKPAIRTICAERIDGASARDLHGHGNEAARAIFHQIVDAEDVWMRQLLAAGHLLFQLRHRELIVRD